MNKTALITGSSAGIGLDIAKKLSESGIKIFLTGRDNEKLAKQAKKINAAGYLAGDLCREEFIQELVKTARKKLTRIDILVNNAGAYIWAPIEKTSPEMIGGIIKLNLQAPYELIRLVTPEMKNSKWGRIINIGSLSGMVGEANASLYSASKAGLIGLTKSLALELAEFNITVNLINPGWVKTGMTEPLFED